MRYKFLTLIGLLAVAVSVNAQEKWGLLKCIQYAMDNNISVKQVDLQSRIAELTLKQSKYSQYPSLNFSGGPGFNSGRNQDPTSFSLTTQSFISANMQLQSSADIFNWFSKRNTIAANEWELLAARANTNKLKNDIALTVANLYLQILLGMEQEKIAGVQLQQSRAQLSNTRKLVDAGTLPELNAATLEAQVAIDSSNVIAAKGNVIQNMLSIKAYMALDASVPFEIETPAAEKIFVEKLADLQPESVYALAIANMPQQQFNDFKLKAAQKSATAAKGSLYPSVSIFGALSSNYINSKIPIYQPTGTFSNNVLSPQVTIGTTTYKVSSADFIQTGNRRTAFFTQLDQNFRQSVGLTVSVPVFNSLSARTNYQRSKINIRNLELQKELDNQTLKQDIYKAYNAAMVALEKMNAGKKSMEASERTFYYAQKRYEVGMLGTFDLVTSQNNFFTAKLQDALNRFDYVFKMKVLEFYKGQGLKF